MLFSLVATRFTCFYHWPVAFSRLNTQRIGNNEMF